MKWSTIGAALVALAGCGKPAATTPEAPKHEEKANETPGTNSPGHPVDSGTPVPPSMPGPALLSPSDPAQQAAEKLVRDLRSTTGSYPPELMARIAPTFLRVIGKPLLKDEDKKLGYSSDAAQAWLHRAVAPLVNVGLPRGHGSPNAAVFVGSSVGGGPDRFLMRMVQADGGWKMDWFELGTASTPDAAATSPEGPFQDFAVLAFLDAITSNAASKEDRALLLGGLLIPALKSAWAEPFEGDKARGYDFNATKLAQKLDELGNGVTAYTRSPAGGDSYSVELMKGDAKTRYALKLAKGAGPGEWLVAEFNKQ
jgi:hypothetical protein